MLFYFEDFYEFLLSLKQYSILGVNPLQIKGKYREMWHNFYDRVFDIVVCRYDLHSEKQTKQLLGISI